jgi:4-diphosphocytidyl-2-C-methyl-D-erythritol kinase
MALITVLAPAKLNLTLDVLGKREDGYHEMRMVMQSVSLADELTLSVEPGEGIALSSNLGFLPLDERNLAAAAALRLREETGAEWGKLTIRLTKRIPVCAGLAGGSSDAAAVLRGLNQLCGLGLSLKELAEIGERVGSDVPYCVLGCTALAEGRGEQVTPLEPLPECWVVLAKPGFPVSTPELFAQWDRRRPRCHPDTGGVIRALEERDLAGVARRMFNVFEEVLPARKRGQVEELKGELLRLGAMGAGMSGTGPTVFGLFEKEEEGLEARKELGKLCREVYLVRTL